MQIIIIGCGKVGRTLAEQLQEEESDITLVDVSSTVINSLQDDIDAMGIVGNGASINTLMEAGIENADILIAVTGSDEMNLLCCLIAQKTGHCQTIARVRNPIYGKEIAFIKERLGVTMIINPELAAAQEISRLLRFPSAIKIDTFARGHVEILKTGVTAGSPLDGMALKDIGKFRANVLICAVERGERDVIIPSGEFQLKAGDRISVVASPQEAQRFFRQVGVAKTRVRQVMLIGGGRMGYYLARQLLATGMDVKIIESDAKRCEELSQLLPEATILHGDGTDQRLLLEEGIEHMDAIAALTGIDEENIIISLFAGRTTRAKVITKVNRSSYEPLVASLSLDSVFYPRNICADNVVRYVRAMQNSDAYASMETLCKIVSNKVEAMEFRVTASADFCGIPLQDLHLKDGLLIGCISRGGKTITPRGSDTIEVGDSVIVVAAHSGLRSLNDIFTTRR